MQTRKAKSVPIKPNELEVTIFGPGYGECVVMHIGAGEWIVVDSCVDKSSGQPAALAYFQRIGVDPSTAVKLVVATHWHDDHVRGLADIVQTCAQAKFCCASVLDRKEFTTFLAAYGEETSSRFGGGTKEMFAIVRYLRDQHRIPSYASPNTLVYRSNAAEQLMGGPCEVTTLSPSNKAMTQFITRVAAQGLTTKQTRTAPLHPNKIAVAIWAKVGAEDLLLGSDLEEEGDQQSGWSVIVASNERPRGRAKIFKIPHHGSETAHSEEVWGKMIDRDAHALMTPFIRGSVTLPLDSDIQRIKAKTLSVHISSRDDDQQTQRTSVVQMQIGATVGKISPAEPPMGFVRLRKRAEQGARWHVSYGGPGRKL